MGNKNIGGLEGFSKGGEANCYASGSVSGGTSVGGLIGWKTNTSTTNCYSSGSVSGTTSVGGMLGSQYLTTIQNSFWDIQASGQSKSAGGEGKTTAQMQDINTFLAAGWNFVFADDGPSDIWAMPAGGGYPVLWMQADSLPELPAFSGRSGTTKDPYLIAEANDLNSIGGNPRLMDKCFRLTKDIDLKGVNLYIIGEPHNPFNGILDGNGHTISNFTYNSYSADLIGLVGILGKGGQVKNLGLTNVHVTGNKFIGGLVAGNYGTVTNCYSSGYISGSQYIGGLVGYNRGLVDKCYSSGMIIGSQYLGGLVGYNGSLLGHSSIVDNCYSFGAVSGNQYVGGLVGYNDDTVDYCYSYGTVFGASFVGGLVGAGSVISDVSHSFWDIQTSGQSSSAGGKGLTTKYMKDFYTYWTAGWSLFKGEGDINDYIWFMSDRDYPRLTWQGQTVQYQYGGGSGTDTDPYLIYTADQFNAIGANSRDWAKNFKLMADIDLSAYKGTQFDRIGTNYDNSFQGVLDGNGHTISNFTYNSKSTNEVGLVGCLGEGGLVMNLGLVDVNVTGKYCVGGLVGESVYGTLINCFSSGSVSGTENIGGLIGHIERTTPGTTPLINCYSSGSVSGTKYIGGLIGSGGSMKNCYSSVSVSGNGDYIGGLVGSGGGVAVNSFWDIQTSGQSWSAGGKGLTTAQMQDINTYLTGGWDFVGEMANGEEDIWFMPVGDYPRLTWEKDSP